jgi:hypothetical protein
MMIVILIIIAVLILAPIFIAEDAKRANKNTPLPPSRQPLK